MRFREILKENRRAYLPMFTSLYAKMGLDMPEGVGLTIDEYERIFKRRDRVTWMLRWYRFDQVGTNDALADLDEKHLALATKMAQQLGCASLHDADRQMESWDRNYGAFEHFLSVPAPAIQALVWDKQLPSELLAELKSLEAQWQATADQRVKLTGDEEVLIDFKNGWKWYDLKKPGCPFEAKAMGHCGNGAGSPGETVLSLRKDLEGGYARPSLTFIMDDNGYIGEMKGRENNRPAEKYHGMIEALLRLPMVKGIKGGGYLPGRNFALDHLPRDKKEELAALKPHLSSLRDLQMKYNNLARDSKIGGDQTAVREAKANLDTMLEKSLDSHGYDYFHINGSDIIIRHMKDFETYRRNNSWATEADRFQDLVDGLPDILREHTPDIDHQEADRIVGEFKGEYYQGLMDTLLNRQNDAISGMGIDVQDDGSIKEVISIRDYISLVARVDAFDTDDDDAEIGDRELGRMTELWDQSRFESDWNEDDYRDKDSDSEDVDLEDAIVKWATSSDNYHVPLKIVNEILSQYSEHQEINYTSDDPRQASFDF